MAKAQKNRASKHEYISPGQMTIVGFESPFSQHLDPNNRWVILAQKIPWDFLVDTYQSQLSNSQMGADGINPRVAIGSIILKHICNMSDRETVLQIQENMYMQYFIGYSSFCADAPFDPSLFVELRKRMGIEQINAINEKILGLTKSEPAGKDEHKNGQNSPGDTDAGGSILNQEIANAEKSLPNKGKLITDATACPQDIAYPTDLNLLNDAREKSEELIDELYNRQYHQSKPRNYRRVARKHYLRILPGEWVFQFHFGTTDAPQGSSWSQVLL